MAERPQRTVLPALTVPVWAAPDPHRLRSAIEDALAGRPTGAGPEAAVGGVVAEAVRAVRPATGAPSWR